MKIIEEKLERFTNDIMNEVSKERKKILEATEEEYKLEFDKKEKQYLSENYLFIQESLKKIEKEKSEIMSKALMENNKQLLNKRTEIIESVFEQAKKEIKEFVNGDEYYNKLVKMIHKNIGEIGEGEIEIVINFSDQKWMEDLKQVFPQKIELENKNIEMLGGCKIFNRTKHLFIDDSFIKRLMDQKQSFLQNCNIQVKIHS